MLSLSVDSVKEGVESGPHPFQLGAGESCSKKWLKSVEYENSIRDLKKSELCSKMRSHRGVPPDFPGLSHCGVSADFGGQNSAFPSWNSAQTPENPGAEPERSPSGTPPFGFPVCLNATMSEYSDRIQTKKWLPNENENFAARAGMHDLLLLCHHAPVSGATPHAPQWPPKAPRRRWSTWRRPRAYMSWLLTMFMADHR